MPQKISFNDLVKKIPGPATRSWPRGEPFADGLKHGSMSVELFAPTKQNLEQPHTKDVLYVVTKGAADLVHKGSTTRARNGDVLFIPAGDHHHFENMVRDFMTWVIFWGPTGGE